MFRLSRFTCRFSRAVIAVSRAISSVSGNSCNNAVHHLPENLLVSSNGPITKKAEDLLTEFYGLKGDVNSAAAFLSFNASSLDYSTLRAIDAFVYKCGLDERLSHVLRESYLHVLRGRFNGEEFTAAVRHMQESGMLTKETITEIEEILGRNLQWMSLSQGIATVVVLSKHRDWIPDSHGLEKMVSLFVKGMSSLCPKLVCKFSFVLVVNHRFHSQPLISALTTFTAGSWEALRGPEVVQLSRVFYRCQSFEGFRVLNKVVIRHLPTMTHHEIAKFVGLAGHFHCVDSDVFAAVSRLAGWHLYSPESLVRLLTTYCFEACLHVSSIQSIVDEITRHIRRYNEYTLVRILRTCEIVPGIDSTRLHCAVARQVPDGSVTSAVLRHHFRNLPTPSRYSCASMCENLMEQIQSPFSGLSCDKVRKAISLCIDCNYFDREFVELAFQYLRTHMQGDSCLSRTVHLACTQIVMVPSVRPVTVAVIQDCLSETLRGYRMLLNSGGSAFDQAGLMNVFDDAVAAMRLISTSDALISAAKVASLDLSHLNHALSMFAVRSQLVSKLHLNHFVLLVKLLGITQSLTQEVCSAIIPVFVKLHLDQSIDRDLLVLLIQSFSRSPWILLFSMMQLFHKTNDTIGGFSTAELAMLIKPDLSLGCTQLAPYILFLQEKIYADISQLHARDLALVLTRVSVQVAGMQHSALCCALYGIVFSDPPQHDFSCMDWLVVLSTCPLSASQAQFGIDQLARCVQGGQQLPQPRRCHGMFEKLLSVSLRYSYMPAQLYGSLDEYFDRHKYDFVPCRPLMAQLRCLVHKGKQQ